MKKYMFGLAALLAVVACNKEQQPLETAEETTPGETTITFGIVNDATKTTHQQTVDVVWTAGDQIELSTGSGIKTFTLTEGAGTSTGTFSIGESLTIPKNTTAVFPAMLGMDYHDSSWYVTLLPEMDWEEGRINAPMLAYLNGTWNYFRMMAGVVKLDVYNIPDNAEKLVFSTTDGKRISGDFPITDGAINADTGVGNTLTINFLGGSSTDKTFYIPLPVGTYTNCTFDLQKGDGTSLVKKKAPSITVVKEQFSFVPAINCSAAGSANVLLSESYTIGNWGYSVLGTASVEEGQIIHCAFTQDAKVGGETVTYWQLRITYVDGGDWKELVTFAMHDSSQTDVNIMITADMAAKINAASNLIVSGYGVTVNRVEILPKRSETIIWEGNKLLDGTAPNYINARGLSGADFWGNLAAGKQLSVYYESHTDWGVIQFKSAGAGWPAIDGLYYLTPKESSFCSFTLTAAQVSDIKSAGIVLTSNDLGLVVTKITLK